MEPRNLLLLLPLLLAADWTETVRDLEQAGRFDEAIQEVEAHLAESPDDGPAWQWLGDALERLVRRGGRDGLLLSEAADAWERAARIEPTDHRLWTRAGRDRLAVGELRAAGADLARALELQRTGEGRAEASTAALLLRLRAEEARQESRPGARAEAARRFLDVLEFGEALLREIPLSAGGGAVVAEEARWLASLDLTDVALERLAGALEEAPDEIELQRAFVDLHVALGLEPELARRQAALAEAHPGSAVARWYAGQAERLAGDLAARERRNEDAARHYERCVASMRRAAEEEPAFAETALWIEMQARAAKGWSQLDADDVKAAEETWLGLIDEWPEFAERSDGLGRTAAQGLGRLGGRYHVREELVDAKRVSQAVAEVTQQAWSWNNVAYLLREIATEAEESGDPASFDIARTTFLESWRTYQKAAELAPDEPRIVNDTALIQVYHLQDDLDTAERMLNEAIRVGEEKLAALGPDPDEGERFQLAQAVGDAYQNLGFLYYRLKKEPLRAREYYARSVETDSGVRRGVRAAIRAIDAAEGTDAAPGILRPVRPEERRAPEPEPRRRVPDPGNPDLPPPSGPGGAAGAAAPEDEPAPVGPAGIDWESSIEVALDAGHAEGRPVLLYHRVGGGIGPSVEFLQRYLESDAFRTATAGSLTLLADRLRHTFLDRRRDGRRVACPRAPGLACVEHMRCEEEFERRFLESGGERLGLESNGLYRVTEDGFERIGRVQDTFERFRPERDPDQASEVAGREGASGAAVPDRFSGAGPATLARSRRLSARRELERRVLEPRSSEERQAALEALARYPDEENDELLRAAAAQQADDALAAAALGLWRDELGLDVPRRVLQTASTPEARAAAARLLARSGDPRSETSLVTRWVARWRRGGPSSPDGPELEDLDGMGLDRLAEEASRRR